MPTRLVNRPSPARLAAAFRAQTGCEPPKKSAIYTDDTPSPVTAIAEFAPMGGVLIAYPGTIPGTADHIQRAPGGPRAFGIPNELIIRMQQNDTAHPVHIFVMCADPGQRRHIVEDLQGTAAELSLTFNPDNLHLVAWDTDTFWTRDYGPWWTYNNKTGEYAIAKHTYTTLGGGSVGLVEGSGNVPPSEGFGIFRLNDDYGAVKLSDFLNAPIRKWNSAEWQDKQKLPEIKVHNWYYTGLLDVGGNYMVNGKGVIASSYLVATQNELPMEMPHQPAECEEVVAARMKYVLRQLNTFMGVHTYHVLADPTGTYIGHIDCWGKFLAEDKVLIARSQNQQVNIGLDAIAGSFADEGFKVSRVMCQNTYVPSADQPATTAAYTNSLILNDHVYVPISGKGYEKYDEEALSAYRSAMPKHTVIGIPGKPEFPWLGTDAMHCRTRAIPREVVNNWLASQNMRPGMLD